MRGKYSSRAEAAVVRESAIAETERLRHQVEKLTRELESVREAHAAEVDVLRARVGKLSALSTDGTSEALEAVRQELREARDRLDRLRGELWEKVTPILDGHGGVTAKGWTMLAELFNQVINEHSDANRYIRRLTKHDPQHIRAIQAAVISRPHLGA